MRNFNRSFRKIYIFIVLFTLGQIEAESSQEGAWRKLSQGIVETDTRVIALDSHNEERIFVGTDRAIYQSLDGGENYQSIFIPGRKSQAVKALYVSPANRQVIWAAAEDGLWESSDSGEHWEKVFSGMDSLSGDCWSVVQIGERLYLGTSGGLFSRWRDEKFWRRELGILGAEAVYKIVGDKEYLYAATTSDLYRLHVPSGAVKKIFSVPSSEGDLIGDSVSDDEQGLSDNPASIRKIQDCLITQTSQSAIYLVADGGVFQSQDQGNSWREFPLPGLGNIDIFSLAVPFLPTSHSQVVPSSGPPLSTAGENIFVGTAQGVYSYAGGHWDSLYQGMGNAKTSALAIDQKGRLLAATDSGVFSWVENTERYQRSGAEEKNLEMMPVSFPDEPTIAEVQRFAVAYAEVHPGKIQSWRRRAQRKALLPKLSVGVERNDGELLHWDTGPNPDNLLKGREFLGWDVSLSWDLGELIWNSEQTSIDSRSKLMVELRQDVLEQVTRLYFERRRLQSELLTQKDMNSAFIMERKLRVDELTALLDSLTGGGFSGAMQSKDDANEERRY